MTIAEIDGYEILDEIGQGGMAIVYRARDVERRREVAIKVALPDAQHDLGFRSRFEREARLVAALDHPAILPVYDFGVSAGQPYIVMPYMLGGSLSGRLVQGPLIPAEAGRILSRIAAALDYAHRQGVIHLDLKPSNILFDQRDQPYLADFGIAIETQAAISGPFLASGTPAYISPEIAGRRGTPDHRSDLYSLAVLLFEMLTGVRPFDGKSPTAVLLQHLHDQPPSPRVFNATLTPEMEAVILRALAKQPEQRFQSAAEMSAAVQKALDAGEDLPEHGPVRLADGASGTSLETRRSVNREPVGAPDQDPMHAGRSLVSIAFRSPAPIDIRGDAAAPIARWLWTVAWSSWLGVILATALVLVVRAEMLFPGQVPPPSPHGVALAGAGDRAPNMRLEYSAYGFLVQNLSAEPLSLDQLSFRRGELGGTEPAVFEGRFWFEAGEPNAAVLAPGECVQLIPVEASRIGAITQAERVCPAVHGKMRIADSAALFWISEEDGGSFQVLQRNQVVATCRITEGACLIFSPPHRKANE